MSLTSPLGLMRHVRRPDLRMEVLPWLNVLAVAWMLSLLQSSYIYAPGLSVALDSPDQARLHLPTATAGSLPGRRVDATLTVIPSDSAIEKKVFILDTGIHYYADLPSALKARADKLKKQPGDRPVLLLLAPGDTPGATLGKLEALAYAAGFGTVQQAFSPAPNEANSMNAPPPAPAATTP
jgi:hypothetical protein